MMLNFQIQNLAISRQNVLMTIDIEGPPLRKFDLDVAYKEWNNENRRAKTWTICLYLRFKNSAGYKHLT